MSNFRQETFLESVSEHGKLDDLSIYQTTSLENQHLVAKDSAYHAFYPCSKPRKSQYVQIYSDSLPERDETNKTTDEEKGPRTDKNDWKDTHHYTGISENDTTALQTRFPSANRKHTYINVTIPPTSMLKPETQTRQGKKSSIVNKQNPQASSLMNLLYQKSCTDQIYENVYPHYPDRSRTPPGKDKKSSTVNKQILCTHQEKEDIELSASKKKPVPQPRHRTPCKEIAESKQPLKGSKEQKHGCTDNIARKEGAIEMSATKNKTVPQPEPRRQTSCKEIPEIEEHLVEFREQLKQLKQQKCSEITSMVVSNLNFMGRMMDKKGGRLLLKSHGVMLNIPPDALGDEPQEIFIYVQQNLKSSHHTVKDGFVTPIVHCGTSGLKFKIPVILTFPVHVKDSSHRKFTGVRQDNSTKPWADISKHSSEVMLFHDGLCTVVTDHFTGYGAVEQANGTPVPGVLRLRVGVFISLNGAIDPVHGCLQLRARIWDESSESGNFVTHAEKESKEMDTQRRLFLDTTKGPNSDVYVEVQIRNEQWQISEREQQIQILPLRRFQQDSRVDESCTFNLKPLPRVGHDDNLRQLECDFKVGQRSDEESGVVIRAVHEIQVRPVHRNQRERLNMDTAMADDSNPLPQQIYRDFFRVFEQRRHIFEPIHTRELQTPIQCTDDVLQYQARQPQSSLPQPNQEAREYYGHQVEQNDGIEVRNDQFRSQVQRSQLNLAQPDQQIQQSQPVAGYDETDSNLEHPNMTFDSPNQNPNNQSHQLQPNQIPNKPKNVLQRFSDFITHHLKKHPQSSTEDDAAGFDPYSLPHDFPLPVDEPPLVLTSGYLRIIPTPMYQHDYINFSRRRSSSNGDLASDSKCEKGKIQSLPATSPKSHTL